jgi:hypothetical protein
MKTSILILAVVMSSLFANSQSRIGSGDQGVQGLLAATTRQIVPGSEVEVGIPDANSNERILVTADGPIGMKSGTDQRDRASYCVVLIKEYKFGTVDFDSDRSEYRICTEVGTAVYVKGDFKIAIQFSNSIAYFEKKNDEELVVKLSKIQVPADPSGKVSSSVVTRDLTNQEELNKMLYTEWLARTVHNIAIGSQDFAKLSQGDFHVLKKHMKILPDQDLEFRGAKIEKEIAGVYSTGGIVYVLPGVYKIKWRYKEGRNSYQITSGIVVK